MVGGMVLLPEQNPLCPSDIAEEVTADGEIPAPGLLRPCWEGCPNRPYAIFSADINPAKVQEIQRAHREGRFLNCRNRKAGL